MRIAHLVLAHSDPEMFGRLTRAVAHPEDVTIAHIDAKTDIQPFRRMAAPNVQFVADRTRVYWGGFSIVDATLAVMRSALARPDWDYAALLSGLDYPVRRRVELVDHLRGSRGTNYLSFYRMGPGTQFWHVTNTFSAPDLIPRLPRRARPAVDASLDLINRVAPDRTFPAGWRPYRGSAWWCLTREAVAYVIETVDSGRASRLVRYMRWMTLSDEIFFHTILLNSELAPTFARWDPDGSVAPGTLFTDNKAHLHYIDWDPEREDPAVLDAGDWERVVASGRFFARKFRTGSSESLLDLIDRSREG